VEKHQNKWNTFSLHERKQSNFLTRHTTSEQQQTTPCHYWRVYKLQKHIPLTILSGAFPRHAPCNCQLYMKRHQQHATIQSVETATYFKSKSYRLSHHKCGRANACWHRKGALENPLHNVRTRSVRLFEN